MKEEIKNDQIENTEGKKSLNFDKENATLLLDVVPKSSSFDKVRGIAQREGLSPKTESHITIIGRETGEMILDKISSLSPEERDDLLSRLENLSKNFTWSYIFSSEYYLISKEYDGGDDGDTEVRRAIIQTLTLPDLQPFYSELNELLGVEFDVPFPHVTLFTTSTKEQTRLRGIGIYSEEQLKTLDPTKIDID